MASLYPTLFDGFFPIFGLHLRGYLKIPESLATKTLFHLHDRSDTTIPWRGGGESGWFYVGINETMSRWGAVRGCNSSPTKLHTKWSGENDPDGLNLECWHYENCKAPQGKFYIFTVTFY